MQLKIMTFNIQHGSNYPRHLAGETDDFKLIDFDPVIRAIREQGAPIIGLNEVRDITPGIQHPCFTPQVRTIAEGLGYAYYHFGRAIDIAGKGAYGNGLISKYPFRSVETIPIADPAVKDEDAYYESRCIIKAVIDVPDEATGEVKPLTVMVTHMGLAKAEAKNAVEAALRMADPQQPTILMGDFNLQPDSPIIAPLLSQYQDAAQLLPENAYSFPSDAPDRKIDYIVASGPVRFVHAEIPAIIVSDHRPHTAVIDY